VAACTVHGDVYTGDVHRIELAPGVVRPPDGIGVPAAGVHMASDRLIPQTLVDDPCNRLRQWQVDRGAGPHRRPSERANTVAERWPAPLRIRVLRSDRLVGRAPAWHLHR
jgi:hypothetical protein